MDHDLRLMLINTLRKVSIFIGPFVVGFIA